MVTISDEDRFQFDLQGYVLLRGALDEADRKALLAEVERLETQDFDDSRFPQSYNEQPADPTKAVGANGSSIRLNSLLRNSEVFDRVIDYPTVLPYLEAFMDRPQLGNAWAISKFEGAAVGGWHRGRDPMHYAVRNGDIRTRMLNTVYFLTDNGPDDGSMAVIPGGHKSNFDLKWQDYPGRAMPGSITVTGKAGDILIFTETLLHTGLAKTTPGRRSNIYLNYISLDANVMTYSPQHNHHFAMPPQVRARFTEPQRELTQWMEHVQTVA